MMVVELLCQLPWAELSIGLLLLVVIRYIQAGFFNGLRHVPAPFFARFTRLYRLSLVYKGDAPEQYRRLHERYGDIVRVGPNHVSVADPAMIPSIYGLGKNFKKTPFYTSMAPHYEGKILDSMFTERNPEAHKALKSPVAQLFSMTNMRNYEPYADECTRIFVDAMRHLEGQPIDFAKWLQWYAFDVIGSITFQRRFGFLENRKDVDDMIRGIDEGLMAVKVVSQFEELVSLLQALAQSGILGLIKVVPDTMHKFMMITEAEIERYDCSGKQPGRTDFLSQLREKEKSSGNIPPRAMMNHLSNNLLAGSDTTAISLRSIFYYIVKSPGTYEKVLQEIDGADQQGLLSEFITYSECLKLPYLQAVIKEAMRMHPAVGFPLERFVPPEGAEICDFKIPGGTNISMSAPVLHMNKRIFGADADRFRAERWLEASPDQLKTMERSFLAFGHGSRSCVGKNISIMEMGKFVPQILRHFDVEWASSKAEWKTHTAWFSKQSDFQVVLRRRL